VFYQSVRFAFLAFLRRIAQVMLQVSSILLLHNSEEHVSIVTNTVFHLAFSFLQVSFAVGCSITCVVNKIGIAEVLRKGAEFRLDVNLFRKAWTVSSLFIAVVLRRLTAALTRYRAWLSRIRPDNWQCHHNQCGSVLHSSNVSSSRRQCFDIGCCQLTWSL